MRCGLGSIPLYPGQDPSLVSTWSSAVGSLVNQNESNIMLMQHLQCRPFLLAIWSHFQVFESPRGIRSWLLGTVAISCFQQSLSVQNFGDKGPQCPSNCCQFTSPKRKSRKRGIKKMEGNSGSREKAERVGCERTRKIQEKAKAAKVFKYKIKSVCSSLMWFLIFLSLPWCSLEPFKENQCSFKYHAYFWSLPLINILRWSRKERDRLSWLTKSTIPEVEV